MFKLLQKIESLLYYGIKYPVYKMLFNKIGSRTRIFSPLKIEGYERILLGSKIIIGYKTWLACLPLTQNKDCKLVIGEGTCIGNFNHIYCTSEIIIGKKVLTADKVYISDNLHTFESTSIPIMDQPIKQLSNVKIGDGAWIGENVCIIGASVGKQSIIGSNSVVTKNIPDFCLAVGAPAKVIKKYNFDTNSWERVLS